MPVTSISRKEINLPEWQSVKAPAGAFIGWGNTPGQYVTGKVVAFDANSGRDFDGDPCPELSVELIEPAASFRKGQRTDYPVGETVRVTCAQAGLRRDILVAELTPGDLVKIVLVKLVPTAKSPAKIFDLQVARGSAASPPPAQVSFGGDLSPQPPF